MKHLAVTFLRSAVVRVCGSRSDFRCLILRVRRTFKTKINFEAQRRGFKIERRQSGATEVSTRSVKLCGGTEWSEASVDEVGGLAQLGERLPCKQEVSGSIPLISTMSCKTEKVRSANGPIAQLARAHD